MPLIGRSSDIDRILATVRSARESTLTVIGGQGTGKSALLSEIRASSGCRTVFLAASAAETGWPFSGLTALLDAMDDPALAGTAGRIRPEASAENDIRALAGMLVEDLHRRTSSRTVIVIDDADRLDSCSGAVLGYVARRLAGTEIVVLASLRPPAADSPFSGLPALYLEALAYGDVVRLLDALPARPTAAAAAHAVAAAARGNPLAAVELYQSLVKHEAAGGSGLPVPLPCPRSLEDGHASAVNALSAGARGILDLLSLSQRTDSGALAEAAGGGWQHADELVAGGIADRSGPLLGIRDQLLRSHVLGAMAPAARAAGHLALARTSGVHDPHAQCWHLSFTAPGPRTPFRLLRSAADLVSGGDMAFAMECVERALALGPGGAETAAGLLRVAELLAKRGEPVYAGRCLEAALHASPTPALALRLTGLSFQIEFLQGGTVSAAMVLRLAKEAGRHDPAYAAWLLAVAALYFAEQWETGEAAGLLQHGSGFQAGATDDSLAVAGAVGMLLSVIGGGSGTAACHTAPAADAPLPVLLVHGRALSYAEQYGRARDVFDRVRGSAGAGDAVWRDTAAFLSADNDIRAGNVRSALARIDEIERTEPRNRYLRGMRHVFRVWRAHMLGDEALARACTTDAQRFAGGDSHLALTARIAACNGQFALLRGDLAEALAQLSRAVEIGRALANPTLLRCEPDLVEVLVRLGRHRDAGQALLRLETRSVGLRSPWLLAAAARSRAMLADGEQSLQLFSQALEGGGGRESVLERGRTLLCHAERLTALGRIREGRVTLTHARVLFEEAGAQAWTRHAAGLLLGDRGEPAARRGNPALLPLTDHERALATMVARGMRNKEIAATLYVSVRTVEVRLTAIYRKLGVESRAQLTALAAGKAATAAGSYVLPQGRQ